MFKLYRKDDLGYLYLDSSIKIYETYTINPSDISGLINIDVDVQSRIFGIEIIPASYISNSMSLESINLSYDSVNDILLIEFSKKKEDFIIRNEGDYYNPPHMFNGNFEIGLLDSKIIYFRVKNASTFLPSWILFNHDIAVEVLP